MTIERVQIGTQTYPLQEGQPLRVSAGQTLRVFFSCKYRVAEDAEVPVWGSLYQRTLGIVSRAAWAQTKTTILLEQASEEQTYEGYIDIAIGSGSRAGVFGLIVEAPGFEDAQAMVDDCIEVTAAPGLLEMLGPLLILGLMGMMALGMAPSGEAE